MLATGSKTSRKWSTSVGETAHVGQIKDKMLIDRPDTIRLNCMASLWLDTRESFGEVLCVEPSDVSLQLF